MGQPIISPWVIYLINITDGLKFGCLIGAVLVTCMAVLCLLELFLWAEDRERSKTLVHVLSIIAFILWILFIFLPSKEVLVEMIVAKHITYENVDNVTTELKRIEEAFLKYLEK